VQQMALELPTYNHELNVKQTT